MHVSFTKMHGAGNDFAVFDARNLDISLPPATRRALADRATGIGCDQVIVLYPPEAPGAAVLMRIYNPDGTESGTCGNATRCIAAFVGQQTGQDHLAIETIAGLLPAKLHPDGLVSIDMGEPALEWAEIPLAAPCDTLHLPLAGDPAACAMGNPHATFFVNDPASPDPASLGPVLEHNPLFPQRANIGFAQILAPDHIRLRVWERGAGLTRACGSGACAAMVNAHRRGLTGRHARIEMDGGTLDLAWHDNNHVIMTGPSVTVFTGQIDLASLAPSPPSPAPSPPSPAPSPPSLAPSQQ